MMNRQLPASLGEDFVKYVPRTRYSSGVTEEQKKNIASGFKKTGKIVKDIWSGSKEFKDARNPLNWGHNIGAVGARGLESYTTFDANNPQELAMEMVDKAIGAKGIGMSIVKEIPVVKPIAKAAERYTDEALKNLGNIINPRQVEVAGTGLKIKPGNVPDDLARQSAQPLQVGHKMERSTRTDNLEGLIRADAPNPQIVDYLQKGPGGKISTKYTDRPGYFTADELAARPEVLEQLFTRNKNIKKLQEKYLNKLSISRADPGSKRKVAAMSNAQRAWYDEVAKNLFSDEMLIYGKDKPRQLVAQATKWVTRDEWHHIFGNKEAGEFLMSQVAQDPLVAVNLMAHMKRLGLNSSGIAQNIAIMKKAGHNNFHKWLKEMGFESVAGKQSPLAIDQYATEISKYITEGVQTTAKSGKPKFYPANPDAVNDLFGMLEYYAEANKFIRKKLKAGKVTMEDGTVLSLAAGKTEKLPEVMSELKSKKVSGFGDVLRSAELMKTSKIGTRGRKPKSLTINKSKRKN